MYQSIGINLSKDLDLATKRIKVPAITQRPYYKNANKYEEEYINNFSPYFSRKHLRAFCVQ